MRQLRHARAEIVRHPFENLGGVDLLLLRRPPDPLEAVRHALEALDVSGHVPDARLAKLVAFAIAEQLDPSGKAGDGRAKLMRRLPGHAGPDPFAIGASPRLHRV